MGEAKGSPQHSGHGAWFPQQAITWAGGPAVGGGKGTDGVSCVHAKSRVCC